MYHLDDVMKALYKLDAGNVHVMGNIGKPGSVYIIFTEARPYPTSKNNPGYVSVL